MDDAGVNVKVVFTAEEPVAGGIKQPCYRLVFNDAKTQRTYRIDAVPGIVSEKSRENLGASKNISSGLTR